MTSVDHYNELKGWQGGLGALFRLALQLRPPSEGRVLGGSLVVSSPSGPGNDQDRLDLPDTQADRSHDRSPASTSKP